MLWEVETDSYCFPGRITDLKKISPCGIWCCIDWCFYNKIMGIKLPLIEYYENDGPREKNCLLANGCTRQLFRLWINSALDLCPRAYLWTAHQALMWIKKKKQTNLESPNQKSRLWDDVGAQTSAQFPAGPWRRGFPPGQFSLANRASLGLTPLDVVFSPLLYGGGAQVHETVDNYVFYCCLLFVCFRILA